MMDSLSGRGFGLGVARFAVPLLGARCACFLQAWVDVRVRDQRAEQGRGHAVAQRSHQQSKNKKSNPTDARVAHKEQTHKEQLDCNKAQVVKFFAILRHHIKTASICSQAERASKRPALNVGW